MTLPPHNVRFISNIPRQMFLQLVVPLTIEKWRRARRRDESSTRVKVVDVLGSFVLVRFLYCSRSIGLGDHVRLNHLADGSHWTLGWMTSFTGRRRGRCRLLIRFDEDLTREDYAALKPGVNLFFYRSSDNFAAYQEGPSTVHLSPAGGGSYPHIRGWDNGERPRAIKGREMPSGGSPAQPPEG